MLISSGGYDGSKYLNKILEFNYETETWTEIGTIEEARGQHAVSVVSYDDYANWCN